MSLWQKYNKIPLLTKLLVAMIVGVILGIVFVNINMHIKTKRVTLL